MASKKAHNEASQTKIPDGADFAPEFLYQISEAVP